MIKFTEYKAQSSLSHQTFAILAARHELVSCRSTRYSIAAHSRITFRYINTGIIVIIIAFYCRAPFIPSPNFGGHTSLLLPRGGGRAPRTLVTPSRETITSRSNLGGAR